MGEVAPKVPTTNDSNDMCFHGVPNVVLLDLTLPLAASTFAPGLQNLNYEFPQSLLHDSETRSPTQLRNLGWREPNCLRLGIGYQKDNG